MRQRQLIFLIVVVAIVANALGYALFRSRRPSSPPAAPPAAVAPTPKPPEDAEREKRGQAQRQAGYQSLLEGDYDKALIQLTEARSNLADKNSVDDLLRITEQLRAKALAQGPSVAPSAGAVAPPEDRADTDAREGSHAAKAKPARRPPPPVHAEAARPEPARVAKAEPAPSAATPVTVTGLLLVTSTPRGLLVHVDGAATDLTPMRSSVSAGVHRVALYDGDRKLFETLVEVIANRPTTVVKDLTQELAPPAVTAPEPAPTAKPSAPPPVAAQQPVTVAAQVASSTKGGLEITSPGLYAEVWVNGRPYGFPPAKVEGLPAGSADVEIRINGVVKRARTVNVEAGKVTAVKITR